MSYNTVLLVIFNHRYDENLPVLRSLYAGKFSNVYFLVPFYDGDDKDVIPVYSSSDTFQVFFTYAYLQLKELDFDYWFFVADDMIINPCLNESNIAEKLQITTVDSFTTRIKPLNDATRWGPAHRALNLKLNSRFVKIQSELPSEKIAFEILERNGVPSGRLHFYNTYGVTKGNDFAELLEKSAMYGKRFLTDINTTLSGTPLLTMEYPLCTGYSDIFCIGKKNIKKFVHYCGVFGAANLFVEIAVPTSILLSTNGVVRTEMDIEYRGRALWGEDKHKELGKFNFNLQKFIDNFPEENLFMHPIKLSKWK